MTHSDPASTHRCTTARRRAVPRPRDSRTTEELVSAARTCEAHAWTEIVARYEGMVRAVARTYRLSDADLADTVQNTWLRAIERLDALREPERLGGWLASIARREALATLRRLGREEPMPIHAMEPPAADPGPEAVVIRGEVRHAVSRVVATLPPGRRDFVHALFYAPDRSYADISRDLLMPTGSIGPTRKRVLCTLRSGLAEAGFSTASVA